MEIELAYINQLVGEKFRRREGRFLGPKGGLPLSNIALKNCIAQF